MNRYQKALFVWHWWQQHKAEEWMPIDEDQWTAMVLRLYLSEYEQ